MGFLSRQDRRLAFLDCVARTPDGMGWISLNNMPGHKPVEEHANRSQVLFYGGWRKLVLQVVHECRDVERLDLRELVKVFGGAPFGETAGRVQIGPSRMGVVDLCREKLEEASRGFSRRREQRRRPELSSGGMNREEFMSPHISIPPSPRDHIQVDLSARSEVVRPTSARLPQRTCIRIAALLLRSDPDWLRKLFGRNDHSAMRKKKNFEFSWLVLLLAIWFASWGLN